MQPLTEALLAAARQRWQAHASDSYRAVVRVRPPRAPVEMWEVEVAGGVLVKRILDGRTLGAADPERDDYSVQGIFDLLQTDLRWTGIEAVGDTPAVDLRAEFDPETGRLIRYRRTVGTTRRRVLLVEILAYEPAADLRASATAHQ